MKNWFRKVLVLVTAIAILCSVAIAQAGENDETPATDMAQEETAAERTTADGTALDETISEETESEESPAKNGDKDPTWGQQLVEKFGESSLSSWIIVGVLAALGIILMMITKSGRKWNTRMLCLAALSIALSFVLSCLRLFRMPTHGAVTPGSMLPIMLFYLVYGVGPGMLVGLAYGVLQYIQDPSFLNVWQFILDYLIAFAALGLAGLGKGKKQTWMYISIPIAVLGRAVSAILAGIMWANEYFDYGLKIGEMEFSSPVLYSVVYNGVYLGPETLICLLLAFLVAKPVMRIMKQQ